MLELSPETLLNNAEVLHRVAPWCRPMSNLELALLLMTQPLVRGNGITLAEMASELEEAAADLPVERVYFQRLRRTVHRLADDGALSTVGEGRGRRYVVRPEGLVALVLNVQVLFDDPTINGAEFEFKRDLVAMWSQLIHRFKDAADAIRIPDELQSFQQKITSVTLWQQPVVTPEVVNRAFDVFHLMDTQRTRVSELRAAAEIRLQHARDVCRMLGRPDGSGSAMQDLATQLRDAPADVVELIKDMAVSEAPLLRYDAALRRYDAYLRYLDALQDLYTKKFEIVSLDWVRAAKQ